jgi:biopolymer transport protein ExbD
MYAAVKEMALQEAKMDMTPMIDVVFQLLIFFMCSLNFHVMEGMLASHLPKDTGIYSAATRRSPEEPIYIKLVRDPGKMETVLWVGSDNFYGKSKYGDLYRRIRQIIEKTGTKTPALIDPEIETPFQDIISTLNVCRKINNELGNKLEIKFSAKALAETKAATQPK